MDLYSDTLTHNPKEIVEDKLKHFLLFLKQQSLYIILASNSICFHKPKLLKNSIFILLCFSFHGVITFLVFLISTISHYFPTTPTLCMYALFCSVRFIQLFITLTLYIVIELFIVSPFSLLLLKIVFPFWYY